MLAFKLNVNVKLFIILLNFLLIDNKYHHVEVLFEVLLAIFVKQSFMKNFKKIYILLVIWTFLTLISRNGTFVGINKNYQLL